MSGIGVSRMKSKAERRSRRDEEQLVVARRARGRVERRVEVADLARVDVRVAGQGEAARASGRRGRRGVGHGGDCSSSARTRRRGPARPARVRAGPRAAHGVRCGSRRVVSRHEHPRAGHRAPAPARRPRAPARRQRVGRHHRTHGRRRARYQGPGHGEPLDRRSPFGYPDGEQIPRDLMLEAVGRIAAAVDLPVTADLEAGYGDPGGTIAQRHRPRRRRRQPRGPAHAASRCRAARWRRRSPPASRRHPVRAQRPHRRVPAGRRPRPGRRARRRGERGRAYLEPGRSTFFAPATSTGRRCGARRGPRGAEGQPHRRARVAARSRPSSGSGSRVCRTAPGARTSPSRAGRRSPRRSTPAVGWGRVPARSAERQSTVTRRARRAGRCRCGGASRRARWPPTAA